MDSMDVNEITKVIDGVYKNITDNFNPASKQMIATGKAYLKSLHGASAACSMYLDALTKLSKQAQQSSIGTSNDIGSSMMQVADVFKEIHTQQLTTLKAFYVDFLVPLETNLEKDVKVIQNEQKKFLVSHKHRVESYNKAVSNAKKVRKKSKKSSPSTSTLDKEIRIMQTMEEERSKLEAFCEEALRDAMTQERRRYGFILERQASLAKHYLAFYSKGGNNLGQKLDQWMKVAKSREALPDSLQTNLVKKIQQGEEECIYCSPRRPADDTASICSQLRKTKSMEAGEMLNIQNSSSTSASSSGIGGGCGGNYHLTAASSRTIGGHPSMLLQKLDHHQQPQNRHHLLQQDLPITSAGSLSRAKSDTSLGMMNGNGGAGGAIYGTGQFALATTNTTDSHLNLHHSQGPPTENFRPKSMTISGGTANNTMTLNSPVTPAGPQETGHVGYAKALFAYLSNGDNQLSFLENDVIALIGERNRGWQFGENLRSQKMGWFPVAYAETMEQPVQQPPGINKTADLMMMSKASPVPPPMPPPLPNNNNNNSANVSRGGEKSGGRGTKAGGKGVAAKSSLAIPSSGRTSDSLHSSNDSGFSNDVGHRHGHGPVAPPPQPEVDYSDEEPQLSNSEEMKPGNKWLMERYHMSETARITSATRRRSLSSGNLSTSDKEQQEIRSNNVRNSSFVHNGAGNSPRGPHHLVPATAYYDESKVEGGALKKFLNRTKSLIWRRPSNAGEYQQNHHQGNHHQNGNDSIRLQRPQHALESISCADTASELWGSHSSIVEMTEFEMKELSTSSTLMAERSGKSEMGESMMNGKMCVDSSPTGTLTSENDYYANGNIKQRGGSSGRGSEPPPLPPTSSTGGPTLPPRNDRTTNTNMKTQMSPGSSSTTSNVSMPLPKEADNSCLVISDHITMRPNKKSSQTMEYEDTGMSYNPRRSQRENDIDSIQHQQQRSDKTRLRHHDEHGVSRSIPRDNHKSCGGNKAAVSRVESFAVSEAPIIPDTSSGAIFSRRSLAQSTGACSNRTSRSRGTNTGNHDNETQSQIRGRRRLWENHANHDDDYMSGDEQNVDECQNGVNDDEQDEDEATIDFNDHDEYDDDAASSVFMDGENGQPELPKSKSDIMRHRQEQIKEPKSLQSSTSHNRTNVSQSHRETQSHPDSGTKRSKSSDISVRPTDTRRSRSTSSKAPGMDTVDMPRRHGGFIRRQAGGLDSVASRGPQKSSRNHSMSNHPIGSGSRSVSTPASRNNQHVSTTEKSAQRSSSNQNKGLTYKGRPIGSPPPIPAPQPHQKIQQPSQPPPPPPPPMNMSNHPHHQQSSSGHHHSSSGKKPGTEEATECAGVEDTTEVEPDYGTIKGSPSPPRKDEKFSQPSPHHQQVITLKQSIVPYATKHQSLIIRDSDGRKAAPRGSAWKGSIRSEIHTVELITTTDVHGEKPVLDYGSFIRKRLYYPERGSKIDQKSERSGNYCGPWYDLWGEDPSVSVG